MSGKSLAQFLLAVLAAPLADEGVGVVACEMDDRTVATSLAAWLHDVKSVNKRWRARIEPDAASCRVELSIMAPYRGNVCIQVVRPEWTKYVTRLSKAADEYDYMVLALLFPQSRPLPSDLMKQISSLRRACGDRVMVFEPGWISAVVVEGIKPLVFGPKASGDADPTGYFSATDVSIGKPIEIKRRELTPISTRPVERKVLHDRLEELEKRDPFEGTQLLCTTFLPPVTYSWSAVRRFHLDLGADDAMLTALEDRLRLEVQIWEQQVAVGRRVDILDRGQLEEYFAAPDYYQMPLTRKEVREQVDNMKRLLEHERYSVCLTPEAVDIPFEIRGASLTIRTDRRNKGQPRQGRIQSLEFNDDKLSDVFEREFWTLYRATEPEFRNRQSIAKWLDSQVDRFGHSGVQRLQDEFDVFLCHNSADKDRVRRIHKQLKARGMRSWIDEENLIPGRPWQRALQAQLDSIRSAAVFVGPSGIGPWQDMELMAFLQMFVERDRPVIPVILPGVKQPPDLPLFLRNMTYVDFRKRQPNPLDRLLWGITGTREQ